MALNQLITQQGFGFATYPYVFLRAFKANGRTGSQEFIYVKQLLFGDRVGLTLLNGAPEIQIIEGLEYVRVRARNADGFVQTSELQPDRILEVNFIDVGQGDGCHIVTPDDKHFLVDAGPGDNMYRFLKWRFNLNRASAPPPPFSVIVSHSDADHYGGFDKIFTTQNPTRHQFMIEKVYHNGLVEMSGTFANTLGTLINDDNKLYITDLCDDQTAFLNRASGPGQVGNYIKTLQKTTAHKQALRLGSPVLFDQAGLRIEVIGPVAQMIGGKAALPVFKGFEDKPDKGKTKNGHSVILRLTIGKVRILLGGDLNQPAEDYLMQHYTGVDVAALRQQLHDPSRSEADKVMIRQQITDAVERARAVFEAEVAKSCHHGSADFTSEFLRAVNPLATVISSGDEESHVHPRPDTLGTVGKHSRGDRSLIFLTELARSGKEFVEVANRQSDVARERAVTVYGMINVRTDGERIIMAQKLEKPAPRRNWDIHRIVWNPAKNEFEYQS